MRKNKCLLIGVLALSMCAMVGCGAEANGNAVEGDNKSVTQPVTIANNSGAGAIQSFVQSENDTKEHSFSLDITGDWISENGLEQASFLPDGNVIVTAPSTGEVVKSQYTTNGSSLTIVNGDDVFNYGFSVMDDKFYLFELDGTLNELYHRK